MTAVTMVSCVGLIASLCNCIVGIGDVSTSLLSLVLAVLVSNL